MPRNTSETTEDETTTTDAVVESNGATMDEPKETMYQKRVDTVMQSVERTLLNAPKIRGENTRQRIARLMDVADEIRSTLDGVADYTGME